MSTTSATRPSQRGFEEALRKHLASRREDPSAAPTVSGVRNGMDLRMLDEIRDLLNVGREAIEHTLNVSGRTLQRRRRAGKPLTPAESDRLWRIIHIWNRAVEAFGSEKSARSWLTEPHGLLHGESPLERLDTEPGLREVEDMLTVIDETAAA